MSDVKFVVIHPVFNHDFLTGEHPEGELDYLGDAIVGILWSQNFSMAL